MQGRQARRRERLERREVVPQARARPAGRAARRSGRPSAGGDRAHETTRPGSGSSPATSRVARETTTCSPCAARRSARRRRRPRRRSPRRRARARRCGCPMRSRCASSSGHGSAASERWICGGRGDRVTRPREREKDPVAGPVDLGAAVCARGLAHELAHARARGREALSEQVEETRRPLDVGEEQRHRPRRARSPRRCPGLSTSRV